ncbi:hypothetical protein OVY01_14670 [Robbsia sp. Bb-Pol-6]|uniref:Uncharacterized protein n=1 Tax=Robbsia betulipollinis TaxID=2981849 RepID=A0ABT3ZPH7_9BURK|nr:hypothetical protein [Robbsia betulipollinis]MCY0388446.1 hypothetical protein [Robbsia betulipollinis]
MNERLVRDDNDPRLAVVEYPLEVATCSTMMRCDEYSGSHQFGAKGGLLEQCQPAIVFFQIAGEQDLE